jgi:Zn-dependent M28 family amino/carboxypeptidase
MIDDHKEVQNFVVTRKGESSEKIVLGAHYDKVSNGCGAVDNWTGVVTLSHLYRSLKDISLKKTLVFVAFGKEETGLVGSRAMTKAITKEQAAEYCAMINIDSLGLSPPQVADNMSSRKLGEFTENLAKEMKVPFAHARIEGADSDSSPFLEKKIPAVTIHGMSNQWSTILHSGNDQASKVNAMSVYLGYRLTLAMIARLDQSPCTAYK